VLGTRQRPLVTQYGPVDAHQTASPAASSSDEHPVAPLPPPEARPRRAVRADRDPAATPSPQQGTSATAKIRRYGLPAAQPQSALPGLPTPASAHSGGWSPAAPVEPPDAPPDNDAAGSGGRVTVVVATAGPLAAMGMPSLVGPHRTVPAEPATSGPAGQATSTTAPSFRDGRAAPGAPPPGASGAAARAGSHRAGQTDEESGAPDRGSRKRPRAGRRDRQGRRPAAAARAEGGRRSRGGLRALTRVGAATRRRVGRRPAAPLLAGLVVGLVLAAVLATPDRPSAPPTQAALVASPGALTGLALGDDRLPDCTAVVGGLTPRQRLAQRLMVGVEGNDPAATARLVHETQVGGIFVGGTATALLTGQALRGVQAASRLPLAVAVDDEGGRVQRVDALDGNLPSARTLAATRDTPAVQQVARDRGRALVARGITMNMAPDVDVSNQPDTAVIGDRSFAGDPDAVAAYAAAFARGEQDAGVFTVLKHFPGHGHADGDSHLGRVTTPPLAQLRGDDLIPYAELLGPGGPLADPAHTGVMVGHLDVPDLTADLPSSLTPATYKLLRDDYHFDGLAITDDLGAMKAVTAELALPDAVQRALAAGADVALWTSGDPVTPVLDALERALASGGLDQRANDTAVERALAAKGICSRH
jgi:beta-N-acetylhexosaminidase